MNETASGIVAAAEGGQRKARVRRMRIAASIAAACMLAAGGALATSGSAYADPGEAFLPIVNATTGQCLEDLGNGNGDGGVATGPSDGSSNQQWPVDVFGPDGYGGSVTAFKNAATGECLENISYSGGYYNLFTAPCDGSINQQWDNFPFGSAYLYYNEGSHLCLESNQEGYAYAQTCNIYHWQFWTS
jgi:hypothetical protein